jgi:hypothetical protein
MSLLNVCKSSQESDINFMKSRLNRLLMSTSSYITEPNQTKHHLQIQKYCAIEQMLRNESVYF